MTNFTYLVKKDDKTALLYLVPDRYREKVGKVVPVYQNSHDQSRNLSLETWTEREEWKILDS